jgi:uncharacterized radical SAM protein YgiQ
MTFPTNQKELKLLGWGQCDIILVSGDAFVDHPSFGIAVIARVLESKGFKVGIIPQPNWKDDLRDFKKLGTPRLFFGVSSGNMDSMVNHYTAHKRLRSDDAYTPAGKAGFRPDYALTIYGRILKDIFPETPVVIGGIEASLRRIVHYDYWSDQLKPSVLADSKADMMVYGMAEKAIVRLARQIQEGKAIQDIVDIPQTAWISSTIDSSTTSNHIVLQPYKSCLESKNVFSETFKIFEEESNKLIQQGFVQEQSASEFLIMNPPFPPPTEREMDEIYHLPFSRKPHPRYNSKDAIPAYDMIKDSVTIHRGCFGGCSFCALTVHQGKFISSRSEKSVLRELYQIAAMDGFKKHISDLGGPSANMYRMSGINMRLCHQCKRSSCIFPAICPNLNDNPKPLINLYENASNIQHIKKITIGSGIRYDIHINKKSKHFAAHTQYLEQLISRHVSGKLKVAPEHSETSVLQHMRKPGFDSFIEFKNLFDRINTKHGLKQILIPYFISSHPGCTLQDMRNLKKKLDRQRVFPDQVQDFMPTPMTLSSVIYYSGYDPYSKNKVFVERILNLKRQQKGVFFD